MSRQDNLVVRGSIRRRLLTMLLGGVLLIWSGATVVATLEIRAELQEILDKHLQQSASLLLVQAGHELDEVELDAMGTPGGSAPDVVFQVWEGGRGLIARSSNAPLTKLAALDSGFSDSRLRGKSWRVFGAWDAQQRYLVQVGESAAAREHLYFEAAEYLLFPLLFALPVFGLLIWLSVGAALDPVDRIAQELAGRDSNKLTPISGEVPAEISTMVERLNNLLERVHLSLESERRFTSDAAHELRTPLAALKAQLQVAQGATDKPSREKAIVNAITAGDRATRLVEQLLTLARLEHDAWQSQAEPVNLHQIAVQVLAEAAPAAAEKHIQLALSGSPNARVQGHAGLLAVLLRNLVDNALRYSPAASAIEVTVSETAEGATLDVLDQGPGIPVAERELALQRFHRLGGESSSGSGLGLSIVARIVQLHNAKLELLEGADGRGLRVNIAF